MYTIGIDVGGTNTDGALLFGHDMLAVVKVPTDHEDLVGSTRAALEQLLKSCPAGAEIELQLSTTLTTNTIVEGKGTPTAAVVIPGPGLNLDQCGLDLPFHVLSGYVDHRGRVIADIKADQAVDAALEAKRQGAEALAIVGKFSQRNPRLETAAAQAIRGAGLEFSYITLGHEIAARLGFRRRVVTAYLNSQVAAAQERFIRAVQELEEFRTIRILKADGGTMTLAQSRQRPIETILSGPAASVMAALALTRYTEHNVAVVDIGGTTTDLAVVVGGLPVYERDGAVIAGYPTAVPAVYSRSIGLGGDSEVHLTVEEGRASFTLGPKRAGKPACLGGAHVTPTDAISALRLAEVGNREQAVAALQAFASPHGLSWQEAAQGIVDAFVHQLCQAIHAVYDELEGRPVYTLAEFLEKPELMPQVIACLGTPAPAIMPAVGEKLGLPVEILPCSASANAIGSAAARPTTGITLHADTALGQMSIPEMGLFKEIERPALFDQRRARREALERLVEYARQSGLDEVPELDIVAEEAFNIVRGFRTVGRIFHIGAQIRPGARRIRVKEGT